MSNQIISIVLYVYSFVYFVLRLEPQWRCFTKICITTATTTTTPLPPALLLLPRQQLLLLLLLLQFSSVLCSTGPSGELDYSADILFQSSLRGAILF